MKAGQPRKTEAGLLGIVKKLLRRPLACFGFIVILIIVVCAIFAPGIAPYSALEQDTDNALAGMSWTHPLGTDQLGRDTLSRTIYGSRVVLIVSLGAIAFGTVVGVPLGLISAYARGWIDAVIMRIMDALVSFPSLIIAVALVAVLGSNLMNVIVAIGIANIPWLARITRSQALSVRERDFVLAAHALGATDQRIITRHMWPNCTAPVIVQATLGMAYAVLVEAALGFIGVGIQPPTPTWGNMLRYAFNVIDRSALLSIVPGVAIFLMVLAFNFVGDGLRDVLDPRLRGLFR